MVLPSDYGKLTTPEQLLVVVDRERVDRGLSPFFGISLALARDAQVGADKGTLPPDPGSSYTVSDTSWIGGPSNALDADYSWMYNDGPNGFNSDCSKSSPSNCWSDRHAILDNFGTVGTMVMGCAVNPVGDKAQGDQGGTSFAVVFATTENLPGPFAYTWGESLAHMPTPAPSQLASFSANQM